MIPKTPRRGRPKTVRTEPKRRNIKTPSLTAGRYVIYLSGYHLWDGSRFPNHAGAGVAVFENKAEADAALVSLIETWDGDAHPSRIEIRPYSDFADTTYEFTADGEMHMSVVPKGEGVSFAVAKKSKRDAIVETIKRKKSDLTVSQKAFEAVRKMYLSDISEAEKQLARFDRKSERK